MKKTIIIAVLLLTGCGFTPQGEALRLAIKEYGAQAADAELVNLEWAICNGISVGAFKRRYGADPKRAAAWREICSGSPETPIEVPKP